MKNVKEIKKLLNELVNLLTEEEIEAPKYTSQPISVKFIKINKTEYKWSEVAKDTWKDETSGLVWLPIEVGSYTHKQAEELQTTYKRLPTKEEFEEAEKRGIRNIIDMDNKYYWSSSMYPGVPYGAYFFGGGNGDVYGDYRYVSSGVIFVRK